MFKNYLTIAFRNLIRHKAYSFINIAGLAIGLSVCILIFLYVSKELSYDNYHQDKDRIFRVTMEMQSQSGNKAYAVNAPPVAPALKQNFPQIESVARIMKLKQKMLVRHKDNIFYEDLFLYTDHEIFDIMTIPFIKGNPKTALDHPGKIVISERIANKYFGNENPIGKILHIDIEIDKLDYEVTGVVQNPPDNTHFKYHMFIPLSIVKEMPWMNDWTWPGMYTYIKLAPNVNVQTFEKQIRYLADNYVKNEEGAVSGKYRYFLQHLSDIHLHSNLTFEAEAPGNILSLYIFSTISLLILLIAGMNVVNLSTARSANRAREVGMRKVIGAERRQLILQFIGESIFLSFISLIFAFFIIEFLLPFFNKFFTTNFTFTHIFHSNLLCLIIFVTVLFGLIAGIYPALFLSAFKPTLILKKITGRGAHGFIIRKLLVIGQFAITITLIIITIVVYRQLYFMKNQDLGFEKEQKLVIPFKGWHPLENNYETIKNEFLTHPLILGASASSRVPGEGVGSFVTRLAGDTDIKKQMMFYLWCDHNFIPLYNIKIIAGRSFEKEMTLDRRRTCIINKAAATSFGWQSPQEAIGKRMIEGLHGQEMEIIGVANNFHYKSLQTHVEPLVITIYPTMFYNISLSFNAAAEKEVLPWIEKKWGELFPGKPFEYFFLDENFDFQYYAEDRTGKIVGVMTFLALFIAYLGLLGLSAFTVEQRTREIGIRKILGCGVPGIINLLTKDFIKLVLIGNVVAWPIAYFICNKWLENFAYHSNIGTWPFFIAGALALVIALLTISYQTIRAATANPVETLRYE